jgi:uncharacterized protein YdeI (YjbR/CyaY-like superfamily)
MTTFPPKTFSATLESTGTSLHWVIARIPVDLKQAWPGWNTRRVLGEINGFAFNSTLFPGPKGSSRLTLLVNKGMQAGAKAKPGDSVRIRLEPDLEEKPAAVPTELIAALNLDRRLRRWFDRLSPSMRKGIGNYVNQAKASNTREMRAEKMAESLLQAMEGETDPPPILRAAFVRQPLAREGWNAMTPKQRRNHLFGIFYVQTMIGRERRAAKAVEDALRAAWRIRAARG